MVWQVFEHLALGEPLENFPKHFPGRVSLAAIRVHHDGLDHWCRGERQQRPEFQQRPVAADVRRRMVLDRPSTPESASLRRRLRAVAQRRRGRRRRFCIASGEIHLPKELPIAIDQRVKRRVTWNDSSAIWPFSLDLHQPGADRVC